MINTGGTKPTYSAAFVAWIKALPMSSRAAAARDHLLQYGSLTTEQLSDMGYQHPPRAVADLQDAGATIDKASVIGSTGRRIAQYTLVDIITSGRAGRVNIPKKFRLDLNSAHGHQCGICSGRFEDRELQADHRIPFRIGGDIAVLDQADYMPLCASDNRSKSWSCEHCPNWETKDVDTCRTCFWAYPENYSHVAMKPERRLTVTFQGDETDAYDRLKADADRSGTPIEDHVKGKFGR
ncbi:hypothetical protein NG701_07530 [Pseudarthrobacter sp. HLT3-5]|uniref:hypothetical protein n=1 Tax=Pseudarthrobacter cellobiosi TaxID=2953654 RepID=UPI00208F8ECF|nr:hypothetical protein [Pseudarthrobacter sp. HLT3-5]MCO4274279.1 hypothetical protein [Pseudarthrobacter sp. HLT3-5]